MSLRAVVSYPGVMMHAQQVARALEDAGRLDAFVTSFAVRPGGALERAVSGLPAGLRGPVWRELRRRCVEDVSPAKVHTYAGLEIVRSLLSRAGATPTLVDRVWNASARAFDRRVARRYVARTQAIVGFEYTALESFKRAHAAGVATVLHLPSLDSRLSEEVQACARAAHPSLRRTDDGYFAARFEERYARRRGEVAMADVIIANSALTKASHVAAGAKCERTFVVRLAADPPIEALRPRDIARPLKVFWAGGFNLAKGAVHLVKAWAMLEPGASAELLIYGTLAAPQLIAGLPGVRHMGSVPRRQMLDVFEDADVLVFPSLGDGFGMVVTEAFSRGVPVIASDRAGASELVEDGVNGLVVPGADAEALARSLRWCLEHRPELAAMRPAALHTARRRQWSHYRAELMQAMDEGLARAGYGRAPGV